MPYALRTLMVPNTLSPGYHRGDEISDDVVKSWSLVDGEDVQADPIDTDPDAAPVPPRPADDTDRGEWVRYVTARGTDPDDAAQMSLDDLMAAYPEDADDGTAERPADSARKAEWVDWAIAAGAKEDWARADDTTKADLQAFEPGQASAEQRTTDPAADQGNTALGA